MLLHLPNQVVHRGLDTAGEERARHPHEEGQGDEGKEDRNLSAREVAILLPLVALALFMGVASPLFTRSIEPAVDNLVRQVKQHAGPAPLASSATAPAPAPPGGIRP